MGSRDWFWLGLVSLLLSFIHDLLKHAYVCVLQRPIISWPIHTYEHPSKRARPTTASPSMQPRHSIPTPTDGIVFKHSNRQEGWTKTCAGASIHSFRSLQRSPRRHRAPPTQPRCCLPLRGRLPSTLRMASSSSDDGNHQHQQLFLPFAPFDPLHPGEELPLSVGRPVLVLNRDESRDWWFGRDVEDGREVSPGSDWCCLLTRSIDLLAL